jgi:hypothetical protein
MWRSWQYLGTCQCVGQARVPPCMRMLRFPEVTIIGLADDYRFLGEGTAWPGYLVPLKSAKVLAFGADEIARRCSFWCRQMRKDAGRCYKTATKRLYNGYKTAKSGKF